ncbi:MAG: carboxylesterase family protein [Lachnospiraceae bacterium]|nr:carboxylesterase family protein [Lachnospiraceae bacterium]
MGEIFDTPCGQIMGDRLEGYLFFRGIPFAETERFTEPKVIKSWEDTFDATVGETDCYQLSAFEDEGDAFYAREFRSDRISPNYADSPMTLNIITPGMEGSRPVLLFVHGGSFETGTVGEAPYGTSVEYAKRDVVLVSTGYRLNVFGLFGGENYGLMDILAAVEWVRENISSYGGDPDNITIMGQSAGAMSVMDLLCSGMLSGKVTHAIMMSGAGVVPRIAAPLTKAEVSDFWEKVNEAAGGDAKNADPEVLWRAWKNVKDQDKLLTGFKHTQPTIDGRINKKSQKEAVRSGDILDVPMMIGITSQDMLPIMIYPMALKLALACAEKGHAPVYAYLFDHVLPGNSYRAFHASDLWYMFGNMEKSWRPFEEFDKKLCATMIDNVAAFCNTGKPHDTAWLPISKNQKSFRHFDGVSEGMATPKYCKKKMFETMFKDPGPA